MSVICSVGLVLQTTPSARTLASPSFDSCNTSLITRHDSRAEPVAEVQWGKAFERCLLREKECFKREKKIGTDVQGNCFFQDAKVTSTTGKVIK